MFKSLRVICAIIACLILSIIGLTGCGTPKGESLENTHWHFESIENDQAKLEQLNQEEVSDAEANAAMLEVFMRDASFSIEPDNKFTFTFLGGEYVGTWSEIDGGIEVSMGDNDYSSAGGQYILSEDKLVFSTSNGGRLAGYKVTYVRDDANGDDDAKNSGDSQNAVQTDGNSQDAPQTDENEQGDLNAEQETGAAENSSNLTGNGS